MVRPVLIGSAHGNLPGVRSAIALAAVHRASSGSLEDKVDIEAFPFSTEIERELNLGVVGAEVDIVFSGKFAVAVDILEHIVAHTEHAYVADL